MPPYTRTGITYEAQHQQNPYQSAPTFQYPYNHPSVPQAATAPDDPSDAQESEWGDDSDSFHDHRGGPDSDADDPTKHRAFLFGTTTSKKKPRDGRRRNRNQPRRSQRKPQDHPQDNRREPPDNPNDTPGGSTGVKVFRNPNYWTQKYTRDQRDVEERIYTKGRAGISHKIKWDENAESFQTYERLISNHCQQHDLDIS
jgi:hypothetical protein